VGPIVDDDYPWAQFYENSVYGGGFTIYDSRFIGANSTKGLLLRLQNSNSASVFTFENCYFAGNSVLYLNSEAQVPLNASVVGMYSNVIFNNCHFEYDFGVLTPPTSLSATVPTKDVFGYALFNVPVETDPVVIQRWSDNGYETGLFG
jgi:hypothetical protein